MTNESIRINFLEELQETIINESLSFIKIIKLSKEKAIKGLTNNKIRSFMLSKEFVYSSISKRWVKTSGIDSTICDSSAVKSSKQSVEISKTNDSLIYPDTKKSHKRDKYIDELSKQIDKQVLISEETLRKIIDIETQFNDKTANSSMTSFSDIPITFQQFLEISYSNSKRYEFTLRKDLIDKATDKLKSKYDLTTIDITKLSKLFELIIFDYIYSSI